MAIHCSEHRRISFAVILMLALAVVMTACAPPKSESEKETPKPPIAYTIKGKVSLAGGEDPLGIRIYCAGTSYVAYADSQGQYAISQVPAGRYQLVAEKNGFETLRIDEFILMPKVQGIGLPIYTAPSVELQPAIEANAPSSAPAKISGNLGTLTGKAGLADGITSEGITVALTGTPFSATTDDKGHFEMVNVEAGRHSVRFSKEGYDPTVLEVLVRPGETTQMPGTIRLSLSTAPIHSIIGRALFMDAKGKRLETPEYAKASIAELRNATAPIDTDGTFGFTSVTAGTYTLSAIAPGFQLREPVRIQVGPQNANPVLVMSESASTQTVGAVTGAVALAGSELGDAAGVQIALAGSSYSAVSASDGAFTIGNISPGVYSLVCTMAGYKKLQKDNLQINPGEKRDLGVLTLQRDVVMPKVISVTPADDSTDVLINYVVPVTITFNKSMNSDTLLQSVGITPRVSSTINMITSSQGKPQATLQIQLQNNNPSTALRYYTTYRVTVGTGAEDSEGNNMEEPYTFSFTTGGLRILFTQPAQNRVDTTFLEYTPVIVRFNGRLNPNTVNYRNITINPTPFAVTPSMEMIGDQNTGWSEIRMTNGLAFDKTYTFVFGPGLQTMDGTKLQDAPQRLRFKTAPIQTLQSR